MKLRDAFATVLVAVVAPLLCQGAEPANVILFIGDGMGLEQVKAGRCMLGRPFAFETFPSHVLVDTDSAGGQTTDSAAAGTAMATGVAVSNHVISTAIPGDGKELKTALEIMAARGKRTGLVTTSALNDATPAAFGSHDASRKHAEAIAKDYRNQTKPNVLFGGNGQGMTDQGFKASGYLVITSRSDFISLDTKSVTNVLAVFGDGYMPYEAKQNTHVPHLSEMTERALSVLEKDPDGLFLMVEGGRIDHANHDHNITNMVGEIVEFEKAVKVGMDWAKGRTDTLIVVTADHETGGLRVDKDLGPGNVPLVTYTSYDHSSSNVGLWAWGPGSETISGNIPNEGVFRLITSADQRPVQK